jgi:hypothetical protein
MKKYLYSILIVAAIAVAFIAGWYAKNKTAPLVTPVTSTSEVQQTAHAERGGLIGRKVFECTQNEAEIKVEDYLPVNTSIAIHTVEYGDIDLWKMGGEESSLYVSADGMYEFYYVPVNAYLRKGNAMLLTGCFSDEKRMQNLYGI